VASKEIFGNSLGAQKYFKKHETIWITLYIHFLCLKNDSKIFPSIENYKKDRPTLKRLL